MVTKIIDIDETVAEIVKAISNSPIPEGLNKLNSDLVQCQRRLGPVHGEIARYLMNEQNLGTDLKPVFLALMTAFSVAASNVLGGKGSDTLMELAGTKDLPFPDDLEHSAVHVAVDTLGNILHTHLAMKRNQLDADAEFRTLVTGTIDFKRKDVGDA